MCVCARSRVCPPLKMIPFKNIYSLLIFISYKRIHTHTQLNRFGLLPLVAEKKKKKRNGVKKAERGQCDPVSFNQRLGRAGIKRRADKAACSRTELEVMTGKQRRPIAAHLAAKTRA